MKTHEWFSGRTIGLPFVPTVGACTGRVVALASPGPPRKPFNWARVLKHELVHVITLQQTEFNIPHWYTEALAVESEGFPRPQEWNKMLLERVPGRTKLLNLDTINLGFIRPNEPEDRQLAYCQAQLYARYMLKRFGADALIKMLDRLPPRPHHRPGDRRLLPRREGRLREGLPGLPRRGGQDDPHPRQRGEAGQVLAARASGQGEARRPRPERADGLRALRPPRLQGGAAVRRQGARAQAAPPAGQLRQGPALADDRRRATPRSPILEPALDPKQPNERVIDLLAELKMKAGQLDEAETLYELARKDDPYHTKWIAGLARVHLRQKKTAKFLNDLAMIADNDADDLAVRKALAERHLAAGDAAAAEKWATECLYIDVYDPNATSCWPTPRPPGRSSPRPSRNTRPRSSSNPRSPTTSRSSSPEPNWAGQARRGQGHARRRPQGRPRTSRGQGTPAGDRSHQESVTGSDHSFSLRYFHG